jgi:hypothetical protein
MPFIKEALDDVTESKPAPEGEYDLRILKAIDKPSKSGTEMITLMLGFEGDVDAPPFYHYLMNWDADTPAEQISMRKLEIKRFCVVFDVSEDFDVSDLEGLTGTCFVGQEEGNDGVIRNRAKFPKLRD